MKNIITYIIVLAAMCVSAFADGGGDITFKPANMDPVHFSHDYHLKTRGIKCSACHFPNFAENVSGFQIKKEKLNKRDFCGHCHNGMKAFDSGSEKNCKRCHQK